MKGGFAWHPIRVRIPDAAALQKMETNIAACIATTKEIKLRCNATAATPIATRRKKRW